jgi:hypothetical protein
VTNEARQVLLETLKRQRSHEGTPRPPAWRTLDCWMFDETSLHGPTYAASWFGSPPEAIRVRYLRGVRQLESNGYLKTYSRWGGKISRVKLSEHGVIEAERLLAESTTKAAPTIATQTERMPAE